MRISELFLSLLLLGCGSRSALDDARTDGGLEASRAPAEWTLVMPGRATAFAKSETGDLFVGGANSTQDAGFVFALDAVTMRSLWRTPVVGGTFSAIAYDHGALYLTGSSIHGAEVLVGSTRVALPINDMTAAFVAKLDAHDGSVVWAMTPEVHRIALEEPLWSAGMGIAAHEGHIALVCAYGGANFGLGEPYLSKEGQLGLLRFDDLGTTWSHAWSKSLTGDPAAGTGQGRHPIALDAHGDWWMGGAVAESDAVTDATDHVIILPNVSQPADPYGQTFDLFAVKIAEASRHVIGARRWDFRSGSHYVQTFSSSETDLFMVGSASDDGTHRTLAVRMDAATLNERGAFREERGGVVGAPGPTSALYLARSTTPDVLSVLEHSTDGDAATSHDLLWRDGDFGGTLVSDVLVDDTRGVFYVLGSCFGAGHFDDGTRVMKADSAWDYQLFVTRRRTF